MILSDSSILQEIANGNIVISPFERSQLNPNSVDLTLGDTVKTYVLKEGQALDPKSQNNVKESKIPQSGLTLYPSILYLCSTVEIAGSKKYHTELRGKSSLARLGVFIDCTANFGDVGFVNVWTLEISVIHPVIVYPNMRIAQIKFTDVLGEVLVPYDKKHDSKYNGDNKAKESLYYKNYEHNR